jgi:hypothetical protein
LDVPGFTERKMEKFQQEFELSLVVFRGFGMKSILYSCSSSINTHAE